MLRRLIWHLFLKDLSQSENIMRLSNLLNLKVSPKVKTLGIVIWFNFIKDGTEFEIPSEIYSPLLVAEVDC